MRRAPGCEGGRGLRRPTRQRPPRQSHGARSPLAPRGRVQPQQFHVPWAREVTDVSSAPPRRTRPPMSSTPNR
eukprot:1767499-Pyramimonas_sp.AAC.1